MTSQAKTFKAALGGDIIQEINGISYGPGTSMYPMQVNQHPWCAPDGVSLCFTGGYGSTENAVFVDGTGTPYTVQSNPVTFVTINDVPFTILP